MPEPSSRIACVDLPALPMQLLAQAHPEWSNQPVAVVDDDSPQGRLLWVNEVARRQRVLPGMRYAAAHSLAAGLHARVVPPSQIQEALGHIFTALHEYSPRVEPERSSPGVFFLDPSGLSRLYGSLETWSMNVLSMLSARGFRAAVIVGFHRFRCHAIARVHTGAWVLPSPRREASMASTVALDRLDLPTALREELSSLGIHTLGDFMTLPEAELRLRYGESAATLHARASGSTWDPLQPRELVDPIRRELQFEPPEADHARLLFRIKQPLEALLERLADSSRALSALRLEFALDHAGLHHEQLEPARPTLDVMQLLELVRLRLDGTALPAAIESLVLEVEGVDADREQLQLFEMQRLRDLDAGSRALARIRALYGPASVTRGRNIAAHLPEASFQWEPIERLRAPRPSPSTHARDGANFDPLTCPEAELRPLVRRLLPRPIAIHGPPSRRGPDESWQLPPYGAVLQLHGPFRVSGGWWVRTVERDYFYAETQRGEVLWVFYDRPRRRWFLHGEVD